MPTLWPRTSQQSWARENIWLCAQNTYNKCASIGRRCIGIILAHFCVGGIRARSVIFVDWAVVNWKNMHKIRALDLFRVNVSGWCHIRSFIGLLFQSCLRVRQRSSRTKGRDGRHSRKLESPHDTEWIDRRALHRRPTLSFSCDTLVWR